ncbi:MAG: DUF2442 domain-containing protein [Rhizobiales bacterium]|nr:DUF2442 domain-containing protein [Hyphomicrobiales bacterium]
MPVPRVDYGKYFETDDARPVEAWCDDEFVYAVLADGRQIRTPIWWYPYLRNVSAEKRSVVELLYEGIWWPAIDEGISIKSMLLGWKSPRAIDPTASELSK